MIILMEHLIEESGERRKFGCLPDTCSNVPCQIGALTSDIFLERMISVENLLVYNRRIHLGHDYMDKLIFCA